MRQRTISPRELLDAGPDFHSWLWDSFGAENAKETLLAKMETQPGQTAASSPTPDSEGREARTRDVKRSSGALELGDVEPEPRLPTPGAEMNPSSGAIDSSGDRVLEYRLSSDSATLERSDGPAQAALPGPSATRERSHEGEQKDKGKAPEVASERCQGCIDKNIPCTTKNSIKRKRSSLACKECSVKKQKCVRWDASVADDDDSSRKQTNKEGSGVGARKDVTDLVHARRKQHPWGPASVQAATREGRATVAAAVGLKRTGSDSDASVAAEIAQLTAVIKDCAGAWSGIFDRLADAIYGLTLQTMNASHESMQRGQQARRKRPGNPLIEVRKKRKLAEAEGSAKGKK